ncbi:30S ribosomal protein S2 [Halorubrum sp. CBA1229]|jgi:small subunit ribosomal protein S2|uniref:30S ribosomal protein S2 n=1 Tax=Halorubrum sp. CBA1229 TaxID=1853699 RepID=UPI000F3DC083|nr:30S ribosomal protein S2 [Halorubrum sp. CBA1229]QKY17771.1 30S ribosomal protein S2 [Halorubrum sp. CBA1229]
MSEDNDAVELDDDAETEAVDAAVEEEADTTEEPTADAAADGASADAETGASADAEPDEAAEADATEDAGDDAADEEEASPFDDDVMPDDDVDLLIPVEDYLSAGVHIGTQQKTKDMERFIHRVRDDGLYVLDVSTTDRRIRTAADFLSNYDPEQILVTSSRQYGRFPAEKFADAIGARARTGRFIPGTLTNPDYAGYIEPDVVVVTDPIGDAQAVKEAITVGIPVIAMCDSNNQLSNVDLVIPTNNKGRRALSVVYWLLANETLDRRGADTVFALDDFEDEL